MKDRLYSGATRVKQPLQFWLMTIMLLSCSLIAACDVPSISGNGNSNGVGNSNHGNCNGNNVCNTTIVPSPSTAVPSAAPSPTPSPIPTSQPTSVPTLTATTTQQSLYDNITKTTPTLADPLKNNNNNWNVNTECVFQDGIYQVSATSSDPENGNHACFASAIPSQANFLLQAQMKVTTGNSGGLVFRSTGTTPGGTTSYYAIALDKNGYYFFHLSHFQDCNNVPRSTDLHYCKTPYANQGLASTNTIAVLVQGEAVSLFINGKYVDAASSNVFNQGFIGLFALCPATNGCMQTRVEFSDLKIWQL